MVCLAGSEMTAAARELGLRFVEEAFADRDYTPGRGGLRISASGA